MNPDTAPEQQTPLLTMSLEHAMRTQRSIRRLEPDPVDPDLVVRLIDLAVRAPSGSNAQNWEFVVITDDAVKQRLAGLNRIGVRAYKRLRRGADDPSTHRLLRSATWQAEHLADAPVIVVACLRGPRPVWPPVATASYYGSIFPAVQNLLLAARGAELGAGLITLPLWSTVLARRALGLPRDVRPCAVVPMGWPRGRYGPSERRPVDEIVHLDRYGDRLTEARHRGDPRLS